VLGREALSGYIAYMRRWKDPGRITFDVLSLEEEAISWLEAAGFEHEVTIERAALYRGRPETLKVYAWLSERVKANLADDGPVAGEEV
jgi:RimJ/RimL family protein N-acetyltransferase